MSTLEARLSLLRALNIHELTALAKSHHDWRPSLNGRTIHHFIASRDHFWLSGKVAELIDNKLGMAIGENHDQVRR